MILMPDADRANQHQPVGLKANKRSRPTAENLHDAQAAGLGYISTLKSGIHRVHRGGCRKCYVHPAVLNAYLGGTLLRMPDQCPVNGLGVEEATLLSLLKKFANSN